MKDVLLLGGTGAMGTHLTNILSKDYNVFVTTRKNRTPDNVNVSYLVGDAHCDDFILEVFNSKYWYAIVDFMSYSTVEFSAKYKLLLNSTNHYIFLSSARVYADSKNPITENSPRLIDVCQDEDYLKTDEYALAKCREEDLLIKSNNRNWTIIRPYITFDEYRLQLSCEEKESWLYRLMMGRSVLISEDLLTKRTTFTYGVDVAMGIAAVIGHDSAKGEAFHITNDVSYTWYEILEVYFNAIKDNLGISPKVKITSSYKYYYGGNPLQVKYDRLYNRVFNNSKIGYFIDISKFNDTKDALHAALALFVKKPKWDSINWVNEALKDKDTKEIISLKEIRKLSTITFIRYLLVRIGFLSC